MTRITVSSQEINWHNPSPDPDRAKEAKQPARACSLMREASSISGTWRPNRRRIQEALAQTTMDKKGKSCGQPLGEGWPRAIRSGTGRGGDGNIRFKPLKQFVFSSSRQDHPH